MKHIRLIFTTVALVCFTMGGMALADTVPGPSIPGPGDMIVEGPVIPDEIVPIPMTGSVQQIVIPYSTSGDGWTSGLSMHNMGTDKVYYQVGFYDSDGTWEDGTVFSIPAKGMKTDVLTNFDDEKKLSGNYSIYIRTLNENQQFAATLFVGNATSFQGFGFQSFVSKEVSLVLIDDPDPLVLAPLDDIYFKPIPALPPSVLEAF